MNTSHELLIRTAFFLSVFGAIGLWEALAPRRRDIMSRWRRWPSNLGIAVINTMLLRVVSPTAAVGIAYFAETRGLGLLPQLGVPQLASAVVSLLLLDLAIYLQHVLFHAVPALWRLHRVHHADTEFDVSTGLRFHPFEILISLGFKCAIVLLIGVPPAIVLLFEVLLNATSMFNHGNIRIAPVIDHWLRMIVVTPDMHRVHHSTSPSETNTNFGFNFPWWDRLLGTYRAQPALPHEEMPIGIEAFREPEERTLFRMLTQPFRGTAGRYPPGQKSTNRK